MSRLEEDIDPAAAAASPPERRKSAFVRKYRKEYGSMGLLVGDGQWIGIGGKSEGKLAMEYPDVNVLVVVTKGMLAEDDPTLPGTAEKLVKLATRLERLIRDKDVTTVLVVCHSGMNRSMSVFLVWMLVYGRPDFGFTNLDPLLDFLREMKFRPQAFRRGTWSGKQLGKINWPPAITEAVRILETPARERKRKI